MDFKKIESKVYAMAKKVKKLSAAAPQKINKKPYFNIGEIKYIVNDYLPGANQKQIEMITKNITSHMELVLFSEIRNAANEIKNNITNGGMIV